MSSNERTESADFFGSFDSTSDMDIEDEALLDIDWKRRYMVLKRKLQEKDDELKALKRRVLDAVMK